MGRVAGGDNPAEERQLDHKAVTVKELCALYMKDLNAGLILGKGGRPKKPTTIVTDIGRIDRHIIPLLGTRRVKDLTKADINKALKDVMAGKTRVSVKTKKLRGRAIVRGGAGTAIGLGGLEDRLIVKRDIGPLGFSHFSDERGLAGTSRAYDQDHRRIRKGFLRPSLHKPLEHAISESGRLELSGSADWESMAR